MLKRMARICCVSVAGLMAACGGSQTSVDASETEESSANFTAAGAPDVDGDAAQTDSQPLTTFQQRTALPGAHPLPESGAGPVTIPRPEAARLEHAAAASRAVQPSEAPELPRACPPFCAVNAARVPLDTSTARPRTTTP
jgi:hypothetical protein